MFSSLKQLAKDITSIFQCIYSHVGAYNGVARFYSGLHHFGVIDSNSDVVSAMNRMSRNKQLYDAEKVKSVLEYLVNNYYFLVGNTLFRQIIGITMGSDRAPFLANLYLSFYETQWIKSLKKSDYGRARRFFNTFRFIDDLATFNDQGEFLRSFAEIYPPELSLKKENEYDNKATFLDIEITIEDKKFWYSLYDKRDYFNFSIVRFPYKCSNIPSKIFHSTIGAETLRICKASSTYTAFCQSIKPFYARMLTQGAKDHAIKSVFNNFFTRHKQHFNKFSLDAAQIMSSLQS